MGSKYENLARTVPCGKCVRCLRRRRNGWAFRLKTESKRSTSAAFITFTYETPPLTEDNRQTLDKRDFPLFMKRLRKRTSNKIKYYQCGEYGTNTYRPHHHAIMFNLPNNWLADPLPIFEAWQKGHVYVAECNMETIKYVTKYMDKGKTVTDLIDETTGEIFEDTRVPEYASMSKNLGANYLTEAMRKYHKDKLISYATLPGGEKTSLPRYYRDKLFTREERNIISEDAILQRDKEFTEKFNDSFKQELTWKKDQIRKQERAILLERQKI